MAVERTASPYAPTNPTTKWLFAARLAEFPVPNFPLQTSDRDNVSSGDRVDEAPPPPAHGPRRSQLQSSPAGYSYNIPAAGELPGGGRGALISRVGPFVGMVQQPPPEQQLPQPTRVAHPGFDGTATPPASRSVPPIVPNRPAASAPSRKPISGSPGPVLPAPQSPPAEPPTTRGPAV